VQGDKIKESQQEGEGHSSDPYRVEIRKDRDEQERRGLCDLISRVVEWIDTYEEMIQII